MLFSTKRGYTGTSNDDDLLPIRAWFCSFQVETFYKLYLYLPSLRLPSTASFKCVSMPQKIKWKTDLEKSVVVVNFERRGWIRADGGGEGSRLDNSGSSSTLPTQTLNSAGQMSSQTSGKIMNSSFPDIFSSKQKLLCRGTI